MNNIIIIQCTQREKKKGKANSIFIIIIPGKTPPPLRGLCKSRR